MTVKTDLPVVLVGAMRPSTALSADGPLNLLQGVALAASPEAQKRGVLLVLNDRIGSAFYTNKSHATATDAFKAHDQGALGLFIGTQPKFFYTPAVPIDKAFFNMRGVHELPRVDILYAHGAQDSHLLDLAVKNGAKGLVIAGVGNGNVSTVMEEAVATLTSNGFPVVMTTRTGAGYVSSKTYAISSGFLNAPKARIMLQLAIATGADQKAIEVYFDHQR